VLRTATPFNFCVIDEVDSILIDEARTPLIISGTSDKPSDKYYKAAKIADALTKVRGLFTTFRAMCASRFVSQASCLRACISDCIRFVQF